MENTKQRLKSHSTTVYKTTKFTTEQVEHLKESANRQEQIIGRVFYGHPNGLTPSGVQEELEANGETYGLNSQLWPITSTRRAITNLTNDNILIKTERSAIGNFGRPESVWRWKRPEDFKAEPEQLDAFGKPELQSKSKAYSQ